MLLSYTLFIPSNCLFYNKYTVQMLSLYDNNILSVGVNDINGVQYIYFGSLFIQFTSNIIGKYLIFVMLIHVVFAVCLIPVIMWYAL